MAAKKSVTKKKTVRKTPAHPLMVNGKDWDKEKVVDHICDELATSSKSLGTILLNGYHGKSLPSYSTVMKWMTESDELLERYARAKEAQMDFLGEEQLEIHNKAWVPVLTPDGDPIMTDGKALMTVDKASAAIVRLEADNKKWLMGKLKPKKYGEKIGLEHTGRDGGPIETVTADMDPVEAARLYKELLAGGK